MFWVKKQTSNGECSISAPSGFVIERMCEPTPTEELKLKDPKGYDRLCHLPAFIFVRARKGIS
jgi:hypothetical protein